MFNPANLIIDNPETWRSVSISENNIDKYTEEYLNKDFGDAYNLPSEYQHLKQINDYLVKSEKINQYMRTNSYQCQAIDDIIESVTSILDDFKLKETIIVYRGCKEDIYNAMLKSAKDKGFGQDYLFDSSFISTSLIEKEAFSSKNGFEGNVMLRILLPKDSRAFYVGNLIGEFKRHEVLLTRNSKFRIVSKDEKYINCILE